MAATRTTAAVSDEARVRAVTVHLLKDIKAPEDALAANARRLQPQPIDGVGHVVLKKAAAKVPDWAEWIAEVVADAGALRQQSPGALLLVKSGANTFALTFGYGRSLLAPQRVVHDFGIRTVLNAIDTRELRSMDARTLEHSPLMSRKQFVAPRPLAAFGVDRLHEVLRGVTGKSRPDVTALDPQLVSGSDAFHCRLRLEGLTELPGRCAALHELYLRKDYKAEFGFIDHIRLVRKDDGDFEKLDASLFAKVNSKRSLRDIGFGPPEVLRGEELTRLRCSWRRGDEPGEIALEVIHERLADLAGRLGSAEAFLKRITERDRIELCDGDGKKVKSWRLYECLLVESLGSKPALLSAGSWYRINLGFVKEITREFDKIVRAPSPVSLPKQLKKHRTEGQYNEYAAPQTKNVLLDRTSMTTGLAATGVEPCDILDPAKGIFVHVKKGRSSADLSHLFNQGYVSLAAFLEDGNVRDNVRKLVKAKGWTKRHPPLDEPARAANLSVVFGVIDKAPGAGKPWRLPFFSMVTASSAVDRIQSRGANAFVVRIEAA